MRNAQREGRNRPIEKLTDFKQQGVPVLSTRLNESSGPCEKRSLKSGPGTKLARLAGYYVNRVQTIILKCD
jgi:hypothetical protein